MIQKWKSMSKKEQLQYKYLFVFMILAIYGLAFYPMSKNRYDEAEKLLHRKQDRIDKRAKLPDFKNVVNSKVLKKKIIEIEEEMKNYTISFDDLDTGFAPVDSTDMRQQLLLEISNLAERSNMILTSVAKKNIYSKTEQAGIDPEIGRPILLVKARAGFWELMDFLNGLKDLSFYTSVINYKIYATPPNQNGRVASNGKETFDGRLYINLEMSI